MFYLVYQKETDGDILIEPYNCKEDLVDRISELNLHAWDYAIFSGQCLKGFD